MSKAKDGSKPSEREMFYKKTFGSDAGKRVLEDLKKSLRHAENVYFKNQSDRDLVYELGRQSVINDILFLVNKK